MRSKLISLDYFKYCIILLSYFLLYSNMNNTTLLFLIKRKNGVVNEVCLAMKKRGFGVGKWNGVGGKPNPEDRSIEDTVKRETYEEIKVLVKSITKVAELEFEFIKKMEWNQLVHVYLCEEWEGVPLETEEMAPKWFSTDHLPFDEMWPDDWYWLPMVLKGNNIKARFKFLDGSGIKDFRIDGTL